MQKKNVRQLGRSDVKTEAEVDSVKNQRMKRLEPRPQGVVAQGGAAVQSMANQLMSKQYEQNNKKSKVGLNKKG